MTMRTLLTTAVIAALAVGVAPMAAPAAQPKTKQPTSWTKAQKDARALFAVLRRPARAGDALPVVKGVKAPSPPAVGSRYLGTIEKKKVFLWLQATKLCLTLTFQGGRASGGACVPVADVRNGKRLPQGLQLGLGSVIFVIAVPDGATVARTIAGTATPVAVKNNAAMLSTTANGTVDVTLKSGKLVTARLGLTASLAPGPAAPASP